MKEGWKYKPLGEVCDIYQPKTIASSLLIEDGKYPVFGANGMIGRYNDYNHEEAEVLLCCRGATCGAINVSLPFSWINGNAMVVRPKAETYLKSFLRYLLLSLDYTNVITGTAQPQITRTTLSPILVPIPSSISEQQSIVEYLDTSFAKIDKIKANAAQALDEAKALFQSSLKELLEPKEEVTMKSVGDLFETYSGGTPTKSHKEYYGGTIPWLRSGEVCTKDILSTEMFITEKGLKESSAKYYPENTVVVAMYGATAAQVGILRLKATSNQAVCGILPNKDFLPEFIYYWFLAIQDDLASQAQGGAQPNISQQKIKKVLVPIYSLQEQKSIVETLDSIKVKADNLQANYDKISQECDTLKQSILKQVFE